LFLSDQSSYLAGCGITTGVVRLADLAYILCTRDDLVEDKVPNTRFFQRYQGRWQGQEVRWTACSATIVKQPDERALMLGVAAEVWAAGGGQSAQEPPVRDGNFDPRRRGPMTEVRCVADGRAYAVGTNRQAYRRDAPGKWVCIDQTAQSPDQDPINTGFKSIDGFSEQEIYAVGWGGEIWQYDGTTWIQHASPTNVALQKVRCGTDGMAYVCGQGGILLKGRGNTWQIIPHDSTTEDLWGLEWFDGRLFVATTHFVYELKDDALIPIDFGADFPGTCYHLSAAAGIMWSIGSKDIFEYNGKAWNRILAL
jgi:hypothetical protein